MSLIPIDIGGGRTAHIRQETTIGELEDAQWLEKVWLEDAPDHARDSRRGLCLPMVCVREWEGMPSAFTWPALPEPLMTSHPSIEARYQSMRSHLGMRSIKVIIERLTEAMMPGETLEGN